MSANFVKKGVSVMRKLPIACFSVALLASGLAGVAQAAPPGLLCHHQSVPDVNLGDKVVWTNGKKTKEAQEPALPDDALLKGNCFLDDVFLLSGDEVVPNPKMAGATMPLVNCVVAAGKTPTFGDCYLLGPEFLLTKAGAEAAATAALAKIKAGNGGTIPQYDEIVVLTADFGPTKAKATGPLFFRNKNAAGGWVNDVDNLGIGPKAAADPDKPYAGLIDGGNISTIGATPFQGQYGPCKPESSDSPNGALCTQDVYSYFDALAQATAALYGPHFKTADAMLKTFFGGTLPVAAPQAKTTIITMDPMKGPTPKTDPSLSVDTWNGLLDTQGSLLGGNTWRDNSNGVWEVTKPAVFQGNTLYESAQVLRFQPMDLYLLGFLNSTEATAMLSVQNAVTGTTTGGVFRSFMKATAAQLYTPAGGSFGAGQGPNMGTKISGVSIRMAPTTLGIKDVFAATLDPMTMKPTGFVERMPGHGSGAPQFIRQLWIMVLKPTTGPVTIDTVLKGKYDTALKDAMSSPSRPDDQDPAKDEEAAAKEELDERVKQYQGVHKSLINVVLARRNWSDYFYTVSQYRGRVVTAFEGDLDDVPNWEFGDPDDDKANFSGAEIPGPVPVPNGSGKLVTAMSIANSTDTVTYTASSPKTRIAYDAGFAAGGGPSPVPNNLVQIKMRFPSDPALLAKFRTASEKAANARNAKSGNIEAQAYATLTLTGGSPNLDLTLPGSNFAYLIPDGKFHTYSISLDPEQVTELQQGSWTGFQFTPSSNPELPGPVDVEFIRFYTGPGDTDGACPTAGAEKGAPMPDGWPDMVDNCPKLFNPDQADSNGDGIGDACEDYDGDNTLNACDNCPTTTNSSQKDICHGKEEGGCEWGASTVAGPAPTATPALARAAGLVFGFLGVVAVMRRRRRK
jgi:hypothetical protein